MSSVKFRFDNKQKLKTQKHKNKRKIRNKRQQTKIQTQTQKLNHKHKIICSQRLETKNPTITAKKCDGKTFKCIQTREGPSSKNIEHDG